METKPPGIGQDMTGAAATLFGCLFVLFIAETSLACSCDSGEFPTALEAYADADIVFTGIALGTSEIDLDGYIETTFQVQAAWKKCIGDVIIISQIGSCEWRYEEGEEYIVYSSFLDNRFITGICGRQVSDDELELLSSVIPSEGLDCDEEDEGSTSDSEVIDAGDSQSPAPEDGGSASPQPLGLACICVELDSDSAFPIVCFNMFLILLAGTLFRRSRFRPRPTA